MHHLIYLSQATRPLSAKALTCLLDQARPANERQHLTGALVYGNQRFIQLLEGEQATLAEAYARITRDPRHQHLCQVADYPRPVSLPTGPWLFRLSRRPSLPT